MIEQFYDAGLAHASYAILNEGEIILIDPARNPQPYYDFAVKNDAKIIGVIETHPHADFVSSHLEIHETTGAIIYVNSLVGAEYPHQEFDEGDAITVGNLILEAIHTPGHSPDSNSILLMDENGKEIALFTGDTLFVGDVGRPDLRENVGNIKAKAKELARQLYHSTRYKIMTLPKDVIVYPAHGAGSLCGRNMRPELQSTIGKEIKENYALQPMTEDEFVDLILKDQPWVPKYFEHDVAVNKAGAESFEQSIRRATPVLHESNLEEAVLLIDTRPADQFRAGHLEHAINIPDSNKFETWLGSIVSPSESFYLIGEDEESLHQVMEKVAKIGYENAIVGLLWGETGSISENIFDRSDFEVNAANYTIVDVRNENETANGKIFQDAITVPLYRLRELADKLPRDKPIAVHCAGGLRSAIATSLISRELPGVKVLDMSTTIKEFNK